MHVDRVINIEYHFPPRNKEVRDHNDEEVLIRYGPLEIDEYLLF